MDDLFTQIESYDRMTVESLSVHRLPPSASLIANKKTPQFSKIGKVMRHITSLKDNKIPPACEAQFNFRKRAMGLMEKWHHVMLNSSSNDVRPTAVDGSAGEAPTEMDALANGVRNMSVLSTSGDVTIDEKSLQQAMT